MKALDTHAIELTATSQKQDKVLKGMEARIAATTKMLPPPPAAVPKAIKSGIEESKKAVQSGIEAQAEDSLVAKFCMFLLIPCLI